MNNNLDWLSFPHVRYIEDPKELHKQLYYMGGEPEENHKVLTISKQYKLYTVLYAEHKEDKRKRTWVCADDEKSNTLEGFKPLRGKTCRIDLKNFGTLSDLRDRKINEILN